MRLKFSIPMAMAAISLSFTTPTQALTYTETPDAGDLPGTAQSVTNLPGVALDSISGALTLTNGISDSDMFKIYISSPGTFSASDTAFVVGSNNFDSQIMLFDSTGLGVLANDDAGTGEQSKLTAGSLTGAAGYYYLLISGSGRYAASAGGVIFPNFTDGSTDPTGVYGPTGPGGAGVITGYSGNSNDGGSYRIALTGAQFAAAVPEPGSVVGVLAGISGLAIVIRRRRQGA